MLGAVAANNLNATMEHCNFKKQLVIIMFAIEFVAEFVCEMFGEFCWRSVLRTVFV